MATIDSPSTMISSSPWRSTKWLASIRNPCGLATNEVTTASPKAAAHATYTIGSGRKPAARMIDAPTKLRSPSSLTPAIPLPHCALAKSPVWMRITLMKPMPKMMPPPVKAVGIESAMTRNPSIAASRRSLMAGRSGATAFVSQT